MADYKILQNIDLAQNEIKEVSKISNDSRRDNKDKGLRIQTGDDTSLTLNRKVGENSNYIKGIVKEGTSESIFNIEPSKIGISNNKGTEESSSLVLGLDADKKEHIEVISPLVDIKTGDTEYTDPHISLSQNSLNLKSTEISLNSKKTNKPSSITLNEGITEKSDTITLQSQSKYDTTKDKDYFTVSLNKTTDNKGNISLSAKDSITESVDTRSVSIGTSNIVIEDSTTSGTESKIEVNNSGIVASKGSNSSITLDSNSLEGKSNTVTIRTPSNVTFELKENEKTATLNSSGTITLTSNKGTTSKEASTTYGDNSIVSKADSIKLQTQGYEEKTGDTTTKYFSHFPHIELTSKDNNKSILVEGKTIGISSKDEGSNKGDIISLTGTKLNVGSTTTEVTSKDIKVQHKETVLKDGESKEEDILVLEISNNSDSKLIRVPTTTEVDINSTKIGIGDTNSTTTISGSELKVETKTNIEGDSTLSGTTTLQSSKPTSEESTPENTLKVDTMSTSITGLKAEINPTTVNIGTATNTEKSVVTTDITIGNNAGGTTKLTSGTTSITSPKLSVSSRTVEFTGSNISINNTKDDKGKETSSVSLTSNVDTSVVGKTFSVKNESNNDILKADTTSVSLAGTSTTITSESVGIGTSDTTGITIGRNASGTTTSLTSETTSITSPKLNVGQTGTSTLNIGNDSANVTFEGNNNLSITSDSSTSNVTAKTLKFEENISSNDIKIRWDSTLNSLVFAKA